MIMATLDNAAIIRDLHQAWNDKDMDRYASFAAPDARITIVPFGASLTVREYGEGWARAFPDGHVQVTHVAAQGELVMTEFIGRGTHTGPLRTPTGEMQPTGRRVEMSFMEVYLLRNGKVTEGRLYFDSATMLTQLNPSAGAGATRAPPQRPGAPTAQHRH
jgi:ketosteroid isomerase-like protein